MLSIQLAFEQGYLTKTRKEVIEKRNFDKCSLIVLDCSGKTNIKQINKFDEKVLHNF